MGGTVTITEMLFTVLEAKQLTDVVALRVYFCVQKTVFSPHVLEAMREFSKLCPVYEDTNPIYEDYEGHHF